MMCSCVLWNYPYTFRIRHEFDGGAYIENNDGYNQVVIWFPRQGEMAKHSLFDVRGECNV